MTDVAFHFNVADKTAYAARLLRKIHHASARAVLVGDEASLAAVDRLLWLAPPDDFVPHLRCTDGQPDAHAVQLNPLLLFDHQQTLNRELVGSHGVLVNLAPQVPEQVEWGWQRCIEIVSTDEDDRQSARQRWRRYESLGWNIVRHDAQAPASQ